jgi:hypothetical protein
LVREHLVQFLGHNLLEALILFFQQLLALVVELVMETLVEQTRVDRVVEHHMDQDLELLEIHLALVQVKVTLEEIGTLLMEQINKQVLEVEVQEQQDQIIQEDIMVHQVVMVQLHL